ncbi:MAG: barstar family protein [Silanimonas sp.]
MSTTDWRSMLADPSLAGTHAADAAERSWIVEAAEGLRFDVVRIALDDCVGKAEALERIAAALDLPVWFGHNWDALDEALSDLAASSPRGMLLVMTGLSSWATAAPDELDTLLEMLDEVALDAAEAGAPPFWAVIDAPSIRR